MNAKIYLNYSSTISLLLVLNLFACFNCCQISGQEIGKCQPKTNLNPQSFCYDYILDYVCLPEDRPTWSSYNEAYRDQLIEDLFMKTLQQKLVQQYQDPWTSNIVSNNLACYYAYRQFLCAWNFPQCSPDTGKNILLCKSVCVSFFSNCQGNTQICEVVYQSKDLGLDPDC